MKKRTLNDALIEAFESDLQNEEKSDNTIGKYMRDVRHFAEFLHGRTVDKTLTLEYKEELGRNYAPASANSMIASLNSFLRFAKWHDCCVKQFKVQKKTYCSEDTEISKSEYIALVNAAEDKRNERLSLLIQTICGTGIRVSEVSYITVEAVQKGEATVSCKGKTRKVFIVSALRKKLLNYVKKHGIKHGIVFITKNGKPMDRSNIWREMKTLCKTTGILPDKVFPHNLRHLFARTFYRIEKDIAKLAEILGHSNINTTRIYIISTGAEHRRRMESMRLII
ncbi:MAG: tyrosine-type recombinase/integrase [Clostridia bacterium]|nr:tyrosine-type recombinase/integrase [Clostridia bacterium]